MKKVISIMSAKLRILYFGIALSAILTSYLVSLTPVYLGKFLDGLSANAEHLPLLVAIFAGLLFTSEGLGIFRRVSIDRISAGFEEELRNESVRKLLRLSLDVLENGSSGELTSRINQGIEGVSVFLKLLSKDVISAAFIAGFILVQCIGQAPLEIVWIMLAYIVCTLSVSILQIRSQRGIRENISHQKARLDGQVVQALTGVEQIRSLGAEDAEGARLAPQSLEIRYSESRHHLAMGVFDVLKHLAKVISFAAILLMSIRLITNDEMTVGGTVAIVLLFQGLLKPIDEFYRLFDEISSSVVKVHMLSDIFNLAVDAAFLINDSDCKFIHGNVDISNCQVLSPGERRVILSCGKIQFQEGHSSALVAKTGYGKSSLIKALIRLYPLNGSVNLLGVDWQHISQKTLTKIIHYIPQAPYFFDGNVRDNLTYGLETSPDDYVLAAALKDACLYDELNKLVDKPSSILDYRVQENGKNLSGGQLKRLAIARAILRTPKFYVLDETLANLDDQTAKDILDRFEQYAKSIGAGLIHISHDPDIVKRCETIVRLDNI